MTSHSRGLKTHDRYGQALSPARVDFSNFKPKHFLWQVDGKVATITLNRPERKNRLTLGVLLRTARHVPRPRLCRQYQDGVDHRRGRQFLLGADEIIGPLVEMQRKGDMAGLLAFTRMTGDLVKAMRACPQPIIAAIDGICAGAARFWRWRPICATARQRSKVAFLFVRVGLAGADMGACNVLPRIIGAGRAAELLYTGRSMDGAEAERWRNGYKRKNAAKDLMIITLPKYDNPDAIFSDWIK